MAKAAKKANPGKKAMFEEAKSLESKGFKQQLGTPPDENMNKLKGKELSAKMNMGKSPKSKMEKGKAMPEKMNMGKTKGKPMMGKKTDVKMPKKGKK